VAKNAFTYAKRAKELAKKKKQEEKRQRKAQRSGDDDTAENAITGQEETSGPDAGPSKD